MNRQQKRHNARRYALQAHYQWLHHQQNASEALKSFYEEHNLSDADKAYFDDLLKGSIQHVTIIDELMTPHLDRAISELNPIELSVLRIAIHELLHRKDVPYKVILNEALELNKEFGSEQGHKFVNAVLHKLLNEIRPEKY